MTKISSAIRAATERGYRATLGGAIIGPTGNTRVLHRDTNPRKPYLRFSVRACGRSVNVPVHKFISFLKYGERSLMPEVHTRHLNGCPTDNRWENIAIGSRSDNMMDRSPESRRLSAQLAGRSNSLPESTWEDVIQDRDSGMTYKQITEKYGISKSTLSFRLSKTGKKQVMR